MVIRNVTWDMCTGLSEMWHETCVHGYQKCDIRHVYRVIRKVTWDVCTRLSEMWHKTFAQGYQKWDMCTGLSEMWHETCAQGYQKCDKRHVYMVIRNVTWDMCTELLDVTWDMCTGLSEMWHEMCTGLSEMWPETYVQHYQKSLIILNNQLCSQWLLYICIPSYRHNNISIAVTDN